MKISKRNAVCLLTSVILLVFILYIAMKVVRKNEFSYTNIEYTDAVIVGFYSVSGQEYYLRYDFFVDGIKYQGRGRHYPKMDYSFIGDPIIIVYNKNNPKKSKTYRDH